MPQRILVIDDEMHILQVLSLKLRNAGFEVHTAVDGEEGLHQARTIQPDLIITDVQMPYMTGLELSRVLAGDALTAGVPVVILTARGYALDDDDIDTKNIVEVVSKPFSPRAVINLVCSTLEGGAQHTASREAA
jgi:CheY-like chemotaxis protein